MPTLFLAGELRELAGVPVSAELAANLRHAADRIDKVKLVAPLSNERSPY